jgi:hypothetical protein
MGQAFICCHAAQQMNICMAQENSTRARARTHTKHGIFTSHNNNRGIRNEWYENVTKLIFWNWGGGGVDNYIFGKCSIPFVPNNLTSCQNQKKFPSLQAHHAINLVSFLINSCAWNINSMFLPIFKTMELLKNFCLVHCYISKCYVYQCMCFICYLPTSPQKLNMHRTLVPKQCSMEIYF